MALNGYQRTQRQLQGASIDRLPTHPLFMRYAAQAHGVTYADYTRDHRVLVAAQLRLAEAFPLDVVSCCSDAWREAADAGAELRFPDDQPPFAEQPVLAAPEDLPRLEPPSPHAGRRMSDRLSAVAAFANAVKHERVILGWVEGPLALAVNLYGMTPLMKAIRREPGFVIDLLDWSLGVGQQFALAQIAVGADMIGIGDAAASLVSPKFYAEHVAPRERTLVQQIHAAGATARLHICGSVQGKFAALAGTGADIIDIDFPQTIGDVRAAVGPDVCLAGNLHPVEVLVNGTPVDVRAACAQCHAEAGARYLLAAGCEIAPETPPANLAAFFDYAVTAAVATAAR